MRRLALIYGQTNLTYTPNPGFTGTDSFSYQVCDSAGNCSTATVTVVVQPTNAPAPFDVAISVPPAAPGPTVSFPTTAGFLYHVQYKDDFTEGSWTALATNIVGSGATNSVADPSSPATRFYRVLAR